MSSESLHRFLEMLPDGHVILTSGLEVTYLSNRARRLLGLDLSFAAQKILAEDWLPSDSISELRRWIESDVQSPLVFLTRSEKGARVNWVAATKAELPSDERGSTLLALRPTTGPSLADDVDAAKYRRLCEMAVLRGIGLYERNHLTGSGYGSGMVRAQYGLNPTDTLTTQSFARGTHPDDAEFFMNEVRKAHDSGGRGVFDVRHRIVTPEGETRWLHTCGLTRFAEDVNGVRHPTITTGSVIDITEATVSQQSNHRLAAILDATPDLVAITDFAGCLTYLNPAGRRLTRLSAHEEITSKKAIDVLHPSIRNKFLQDVLPAALAAGSWVGELRLQSSEREEGIPVAFVLLAHKSSRTMEGYLSLIAHDLTQQKSLEAQLLHSQKLEAVGRLAGGIAHDFNNLLSVIIGFTTLALSDRNISEKTRNGLLEVMRASERASQLTSKLLSISRKQVLSPRIIDVDALVGDMTPMLNRLVGEQIELVFSPSSTGMRIEADPCQIEQILMNLVVNARDAIHGDGGVTIETEICEIGRDPVAHPLELKPGRYVIISVSDTGEGMDDDTRKRIFEPFFTTKPQGSGTGLGLSTVLGIVNQSGGSVRLSSELGHGSCFRIYWPACGHQGTIAERPSWRPSHRGSGRILVVEDDVQLRKVVVAILEQAGYQPIAPMGPVEGLAIAKQYGDEIALLLTDVMMPQMTGIQLADALNAVGSTIPVLFMSGYAEEKVVGNAVLTRGINFVPKPLTPEHLLQAIGEALAEARCRMPSSCMPPG